MEFPDMKGFSVRNLKYMRAFADAYPDFIMVQQSAAQTGISSENVIVQHPAAQIPWTHNQVILDKVKEKEERLFYIRKSVENGWSRNVLSLQIESKLFTRQGNAITNFPQTLPAIASDLARETFKSPYVFDFISLSEEMKERDIEKALIQHLKKFMLELGKGFAYAGNQFNIDVAGKDYFLDLLFYNYRLHSFVVFELKVGEFEPEFAGKLNLYINAIDAQIKGKDDNQTIGVLLCKTPNETIVKYSLKGIDTPMGIAEYQLAQVLPKELKGEIPGIAELEAELDKEYEELKTPSDKKFDELKQKIEGLKNEELRTPVTPLILHDIFDKSLIHLYKALMNRMETFKDLFISGDYNLNGKKLLDQNLAEEIDYWKNEVFIKSMPDFYFLCDFYGLKKAGIEAFNIGFQLNIRFDIYWYGFTLINYNSQQPFIKKLYHEQLTPNDIEEIVEKVYKYVLEEIEKNIERIVN